MDILKENNFDGQLRIFHIVRTRRNFKIDENNKVVPIPHAHNLKVAILASLTLAKVSSFGIFPPNPGNEKRKKQPINKVSLSRLERLMRGAKLHETKEKTASGYSKVDSKDVAVAKTVVDMYMEKLPSFSLVEVIERYWGRLNEVLGKKNMPEFPQEIKGIINKPLLVPNPIAAIFSIYIDWNRHGSQHNAHGLLSRYWLHRVIESHFPNLALFPVEMLILRYQKEFDKLLQCPQGEPDTETNEFEKWLFPAIESTLIQYSFRQNSWFKPGERLMLNYLGEEHLDLSWREQAADALDGKFWELVAKNTETSLLDDEIDDCYNLLMKLHIPVLVEEHSVFDKFLAALSDSSIDPRFDALSFLYGAMLLTRDYWSFYLTEQNKRRSALKIIEGKRRGPRAHPIIIKKTDGWYRCCVAIHNEIINTNYKGCGCNSPRSKALRECAFLKEKSKSQFEKYFRLFEKRLPEHQRKSVIENEGRCNSKSKRCSFCKSVPDT